MAARRVAWARASAIGPAAATSATLHCEFHGQSGPKAENFPVTRSLAFSVTQRGHRPTTSARNAVEFPSNRRETCRPNASQRPPARRVSASPGRLPASQPLRLFQQGKNPSPVVLTLGRATPPMLSRQYLTPILGSNDNFRYGSQLLSGACPKPPEDLGSRLSR